jgi:hypothetical protein
MCTCITHTHTLYITLHYIALHLRPRGEGRKLAWQGAWHEKTIDVDAAEFAGGDMPTVSLGMAKLLVNQPAGAGGDS